MEDELPRLEGGPANYWGKNRTRTSNASAYDMVELKQTGWLTADVRKGKFDAAKITGLSVRFLKQGKPDV